MSFLVAFVSIWRLDRSKYKREKVEGHTQGGHTLTAYTDIRPWRWNSDWQEVYCIQIPCQICVIAIFFKESLPHVCVFCGICLLVIDSMIHVLIILSLKKKKKNTALAPPPAPLLSSRNASPARSPSSHRSPPGKTCTAFWCAATFIFSKNKGIIIYKVAILQPHSV